MREAGETALLQNGGRVTLPTSQPWTKEVFVKSCVGGEEGVLGGGRGGGEYCL